MKKSIWYHYQYRDINGNIVENVDGSTGAMQAGKKQAWQIKQIEQVLTTKHGIKCICKLIKTETA
jgi:hypothetical protein